METALIEPTPRLVARNAISWDDGAIARETARMPDGELRDAVTWLKRHCRDRHNRDVARLMKECRLRGISTDSTNYIRVLKGQWKWDADGNEVDAPCIARERLLTEIRALRESIRIEFLTGRVPFFETSVFTTIDNYVRKLRRTDWVNKFGMIIGATGTQKSACFKEIKLRDEDGNVRYIESPEAGRFSEFITEVAYAFGERRANSHTRKKIKIYESVTADTCLIIDNTQDLAKLVKDADALDKQQPAFSFLRRLQDITGCTIIWSITPDREDMLIGKNFGYMEQFIGRMGGRENLLRLTDYPPMRDLITIAEGMGMKDAEDHRDEIRLLGRLPGRIRTFFTAIQEGKTMADTDEEAFTWAHVAAYLQEKKIRLTEEKGK